MALGERFPEEDLDVENKENLNTKSDLEIVTSSGRGKNGALCVLHSSIKPHIITSFGLFGNSCTFFFKLIYNFFSNIRNLFCI